MKRKALLAVTNCTPKAFEMYSARDFLPFVIEERNWSDYTIENAFQLQMLLDGANATDLSGASMLAKKALDKLLPISPFTYTGDEEMFAGLVRYDWADAPEGWDCRAVVAGRWIDIREKADQLRESIDPSIRIRSITTVSITKIAHHVWMEARDIGLPEAEVKAIPEDLTGYPEWFQEMEWKRREVIFGRKRPE